MHAATESGRKATPWHDLQARAAQLVTLREVSTPR
jgi:hypothetical protein